MTGVFRERREVEGQCSFRPILHLELPPPPTKRWIPDTITDISLRYFSNHQNYGAWRCERLFRVSCEFSFIVGATSAPAKITAAPLRAVAYATSFADVVAFSAQEAQQFGIYFFRVGP